MSKALLSAIAVLFLCSCGAGASRDAESKLLRSLRQVSQPGDEGAKKFSNIQESLKFAFAALPKNSQGRLAPRAARHMLHNYFAGTNGILYRGLEYHGMARSSMKKLHEVKIIQEKAPALEKALLEARPLEHGLSLLEISAMVAALEGLAHSDMVPVLSAAYMVRNHSAEDTLTLSNTTEVLRAYFFFYSRGLLNMSQGHYLQMLSETKKPDLKAVWAEVTGFVDHAMNTAAYESGNPFPAEQFSSAQVWDIAQWMGERHGVHQNSDCVDMKNVLVARDTSKMGRVPLKDFYEEGKHGKYAFEESVEFLHKVGALDTSAPDEPKVLIANYVLGSLNCVADTKHTAACCINECVGLMSQVERQIQGPRAPAEKLLSIVKHISSTTVDAPRRLPKALIQKLDTIAEQHGGEVPLHGRLFAQWIHYAFPNECPYPSILTSKAMKPIRRTPKAVDGWGQEMDPRNLASSSQIRDIKAGHRKWKAAPEFMSQWSDKEVLPLEDSDSSTGTLADGSMSTLFQAIMYSLVLLGGIRSMGLSKIRAIRNFFCCAKAKGHDSEWWMEEDAKLASKLSNGETGQQARKGKAPVQKVSKAKDAPSEEPRQKQKSEPKVESCQSQQSGKRKAAKDKSKTAPAAETSSDVHAEEVNDIPQAEEKVGSVKSEAIDKSISEASTHVTQLSSLRSLLACQPESEPDSPGSSSPRSAEDEAVPVEVAADLEEVEEAKPSAELPDVKVPEMQLKNGVLGPAAQLAMIAERMADTVEAADSLATFKQDGPWKVKKDWPRKEGHAKTNEDWRSSASNCRAEHGMGRAEWQPPPGLVKQEPKESAALVAIRAEHPQESDGLVAFCREEDAMQNLTDSCSGALREAPPPFGAPPGLEMMAPPGLSLMGPPPGLQAAAPMTCNASSSNNDPQLVAQMRILADELKRERQARERLEGILRDEGLLPN